MISIINNKFLIIFLLTKLQAAAGLGQTRSRAAVYSNRVVWCDRAYDPTQLNWTKPENVQNLKN